MSETALYTGLLWGMVLTGVAVFVVLFFVPAPYGRHQRHGWGPRIPSRVGWVVMEAPAVLVVTALFWLGPHNRGPVAWVLLAMWLAHYLYRAFVYPFLRRDRGRTVPLAIPAMAVLFNLINGYLQGRGVFGLRGGYATSWLWDPRFLLGVTLFITGFSVNHWADAVLRRLRRPGEHGYKIPTGGLYRYISCPNYFGEILEWLGWAVATWHPAGAVFALWTFANLAPRAVAHHRWYRATFDAYPPGRKALIPWVW